ncbi:MAG: hypothetical protein OEV49_16790 [candidate division Zixibacteria bacterium]|nr:hypothetical protein [candidate division Zixibacteria bacterium]MDH3937030.1 hypothetical protein [candidate division Zixibacteria bacterium]MDH4032951.1 hypothetical protein [candidate division Zixibacteria bacterium]
MHKTFRRLLEKATGASEHVIAANIDVRSFTEFGKRVESPDTAMFIKRVYMTIIDEYIPDLSYYKPAGDGLLVVVPYDQWTLKDRARDTVKWCLSLVKKFNTICRNDPMINFAVPDKIGIGLCRGPVTKLIAGRTILDYSGTVLNVASRLMDIARPSGIVFDEGFGLELLHPSTRKLFAKESVFIKGVAEHKPMSIHYTVQNTRVGTSYKKPLAAVQWETETDQLALKEIKARQKRFSYDLKKEPLDPAQLKVKVTFPHVHSGRKKKGLVSFVDFDSYRFDTEAGQPFVEIDYDALAKMLASHEVKDNMQVTIDIKYPTA